MTTIRRKSSPLAFALIGAGVLLATACDTNKLLQVTDPAVATPESLANPSALPTLYAGAIGDFQIAYAGDNSNTEGMLTTTALMSDEVRDADTFPTRIATDQRSQQPVQAGNTSDGTFTRLQRARHSLKTAAVSLAAANATDPRVAVMRALEGMTYVSLGEAFCGYIPFSEVVDGKQVMGTPLTQSQVFDSAAARFNAALAVDATQSQGANLARVGLGRALLNNGKYAEAATAVASVPTTFVWNIELSDNSGRQNNQMYSVGWSNGRYSMSDREGGNGLPFRSALDPRAIWAPQLDSKGNQAVGFDNVTPMFWGLRHNSYSSALALATGVEARLIEAEAALKTGDVTTWLSKLNTLRASVGSLEAGMSTDYKNQLAKNAAILATLAPLTDPGAQPAREDLMFSERAFWLFLTGHRLGDLRREIRQYGRTQDKVFPVGAYHKSGLTYGSEVAFPIPFNENQNPNYNPAQCDVTKA